MNKKILAISIAAVLVASFVLITPLGAVAQKAQQGNVLGKIKSNLQKIVSDLSDVANNVNFIREDLKFKKKFFEVHEAFCEDPIECSQGPIQGIQPGKDSRITLVAKCALPDEEDGTSPCAFNVESLILDITLKSGLGKCTTDRISVDGLDSDISEILLVDDDPTTDPGTSRKVNILLEADVPPIGASDEVNLVVTCTNTAFADIEFNGERPQAMTFDITLEDP